MRVIRYVKNDVPQLAALTDEGRIYDLPYPDLFALLRDAEAHDAAPSVLAAYYAENGVGLEAMLEELTLLTPVEAPEVWAAGVTYERSREARNYESTEGRMDATTFYDKVYDAVRPELFFKSTAARTVPPGSPVRLRSDSNWQVPEPELGLVLSREGKIVGYTAGNDMSCRDIEGENPLYLPQAKVWKQSCSFGPTVRLADSLADPRDLDIICRIYRGGKQVVEGSANTKQLKRGLEELASFLARDNELYDGTVLLTGTCIVPPHDFSLASGDRIEIEIAGIGTLVNPVVGSNE